MYKSSKLDVKLDFSSRNFDIKYHWVNFGLGRAVDHCLTWKKESDIQCKICDIYHGGPFFSALITYPGGARELRDRTPTSLLRSERIEEVCLSELLLLLKKIG